MKKIFLLPLAFILFGCSSMLYYPSKKVFFVPDKNRFSWKDVYFDSSDGTKLHGWYLKSHSKKKPRGLILLFHGNAENLTSHIRSDLWFLDHSFDVFAFDYRGYGQSEGEASPKGTIEDGKAAIRWAYKKNPRLPIIIHGQSLGGTIAIRSVIEVKQEIPTIKYLIAESTFVSYQDMGASVMSRSWITWPFQLLAYLLLSDKYSPRDRLKELSPILLLVIHGDRDSVVEFSHGEKLFSEAAQPKEFWKIDGGRHIDTFFREDGKYQKPLLDKLN